MVHQAKENALVLPATPWGLLPPRLRLLYIAAPGRSGSWLAQAFASDSASRVVLEEAAGAAAGLALLREQAFDAVLISHEPGDLDALELLQALRAGGGDEPAIVLGQMSEQEMSALCYEVGADAYVCAATATTRTLLWIVGRATERRNLIRENRRLSTAERHRREQDSGEAQRLLSEQRGLIGDADSSCGNSSDRADGIVPDALAELNNGSADTEDHTPLDAAVAAHYRQLLKAHVIMGSGNLSAEMAALAAELADQGVGARQTLRLHVQVLEEMVRGLGSRGARHVMTRGDLLVLEVLVHLTERYRQQAHGIGPTSAPISEAA
jgi:CheY-like chemotaxis protein